MKLWCPKQKDILWARLLSETRDGAVERLARAMYGNVSPQRLPRLMKVEGFTIVPVELKEIKKKKGK